LSKSSKTTKYLNKRKLNYNMEEHWIIAGIGKNIFPKNVTKKRAKEHEQEGKKVYRTRYDCKEGIKRGEE